MNHHESSQKKGEEADALQESTEEQPKEDATSQEHAATMGDPEHLRHFVHSRLRTIGHYTIDHQHTTLVGYICELFDLMTRLQTQRPTEEDRKLLAQLLDKLQAYTVEHFAYEEGLMERTNYPDKERHTELHRQFVRRFLQIRSQLQDQGIHYVIDLFFMTFDWLFDHINKVDIHLAKFTRIN